MGAAAFFAADWERRLSCRRQGGRGDGVPTLHFPASPAQPTSRPLNRLTTQKSRRQESRLSQWAIRNRPSCGRQESRLSQWAIRKPPRLEIAPPVGQESRPSKPPLQRQLFRDGEPTPDNRAAAVSHSRLRTIFSGTGTSSISTAGASSISRTGLSTSMAR